jgi:ubiquitin C-terminal hydrolase
MLKSDSGVVGESRANRKQSGYFRVADNTYIGYEPKVVIHLSRFNLSIERGYVIFKIVVFLWTVSTTEVPALRPVLPLRKCGHTPWYRSARSRKRVIRPNFRIRNSSIRSCTLCHSCGDGPPPRATTLPFSSAARRPEPLAKSGIRHEPLALPALGFVDFAFDESIFRAARW